MHTIQRGDAVSSARIVQRQLAALLPESRPAGVGDSTLEIAGQGMDAPRLISATMLEHGPQQRRRVPGVATPGFRAFLDGTQRSEVVCYIAGVPIVVGHAAAVIRERRAGRMCTWGAPLSGSRIYGPRAMLASATWATLTTAFGESLVDTSDGDADLTSHPFALRDAAIHGVQAHREQLECRLAEQWCRGEDDPLFIDGGISGSDAVAVSRATIGVVKSHRTLYADGEALASVLGLSHRERSSVFRITSPRRTTVASWYLRLRDPAGHDPMWGLIRVESALPAAEKIDGIGDRADEVSRWILAESTPLALPDPRWDKMVYGIRDCEEFLRATR